MKKFKILICVILSLSLFCSTLQFSLAANTDEYVIWEAEADTLLSNSDGTVDATLSQDITEKYSVKKTHDKGGSYYSSQFDNMDSKVGIAVANTGINSTTAGFGWLDNEALLDKLAPYMKVSFEYKVYGAEDLPQDAVLNIYAADSNNARVALLTSVAISNSEEWSQYDLSEIKAVGFDGAWSSGCFALEIESKSEVFEGSYTVDIRHLYITVNESDKLSINADFKKVSGIKRIKNFSQGVYIGKDSKRNDNYFSLLDDYDKVSTNSLHNGNLYNVLLEKPENYDVALSQIKAAGSDNTTQSELVLINVSVTEGYAVKEVIVLKDDNSTVDVNLISRDKQYSFNMPASDVTVKIVLKEHNLNKLQLLWNCDPGFEVTEPWYSGSEKPFTYEIVDGGGENAYAFTLTKESGMINIFGDINNGVVHNDYLNTAVVKMRLKLDNSSEKRMITITTTADKKISKSVEIGSEWTDLIFPITEISNTADINNIRLAFENYTVGEKILVGNILVWSKDTGKTKKEDFLEILDISSYKQSSSNKTIGIIGDMETTSNKPWDSLSSKYVNWDSAWYMVFRDENVWSVTVNPEKEGNPYRLQFYWSEYPGKWSEDVNDLGFSIADYIDTGYMEFYIKSYSDNVTVPFGIVASIPNWPYNDKAAFEVTYEVAKARPDGWMCVRVPFTYLADRGLNINNISRVEIAGCQTIKDDLLITPFRFYTNYAEIKDPVIVDDEEAEEREIPIELDSKILNAKLDKENMYLYVPENTLLWELLSAITLDTNESVVRFYDKGNQFYGDFDTIDEGVIMRLYRRGEQVCDFTVRFLTK